MFVRPALLAPHVSRLASLLAPYGIDAVCGPLVGGAFLAQMVAASLDVSFTWTTWPSYSLAVPVTGRVAIVDDAINAGSAVRATLAALPADAVVVVGALLARPLDLGVPLESLEPMPGTLWPAESCPLCATGAPLEEPPS